MEIGSGPSWPEAWQAQRCRSEIASSLATAEAGNAKQFVSEGCGVVRMPEVLGARHGLIAQRGFTAPLENPSVNTALFLGPTRHAWTGVELEYSPAACPENAPPETPSSEDITAGSLEPKKALAARNPACHSQSTQLNMGGHALSNERPSRKRMAANDPFRRPTSARACERD
jgi:hypothetical protein